MLESDESGAWGLVINKRLGTMPIALLIDPSLNTMKEREKLYKIDIPIFWGGPVDVKEIFILHSTEYKSDTTKNYGNISISQIATGEENNFRLSIYGDKGAVHWSQENPNYATLCTHGEVPRGSLDGQPDVLGHSKFYLKFSN